jgi:hypothetical protein
LVGRTVVLLDDGDDGDGGDDGFCPCNAVATAASIRPCSAAVTSALTKLDLVDLEDLGMAIRFGGNAHRNERHE